MRQILGLLFSLRWLDASGCMPFHDPCADLERAKVAFVGKVVLDSEQKGVAGPARMLVDENWKGLPEGTREVVVHTGAGWGHYWRLKLGERWLILGDINAKGEVSRAQCSFSFDISKSPKLLEMMRSAMKGERGLLGGRVWLFRAPKAPQIEFARPVTVAARKAEKSLVTAAYHNGEFLFGKVEEGEYEWQLSNPGYLLDGFQDPKRKVKVMAGGCWYESLMMKEGK